MLLARLLSPLAPPLCWGCLGHADPGPLCRDCRAGLAWLPSEPVVAAAIALFAPLAYERGARALVRALKFRGALALADPMAAQMAANAPPALLDRGTFVPVPLHPARQRRRGFNQAERLATALARRTGLAVSDCLERAGPARPQVGRSRAERLRGIEGTVRLRPGNEAPTEAILVDDVVTTGATLAACAATLRASGSRRVRGVAYARTPGR
jgi:ComF family protein